MSKNQERAIVRASRIIALAPFVSSDETRKYLQGVEITPAAGPGCILAATDGTCLVAMHDEFASMSGLPRVWRVPVRKLSALMKLAKKTPGKPIILWCDFSGSLGKDSHVRLVQARTSAAVLAGDGDEVGTIHDEDLAAPLKIEGHYPDWRPLLVSTPPSQVAAPAWLGAKQTGLLCDLALALEAGSAKPSVGRITFHAAPDDKGTRANIHGFPEVTALVARAPAPSTRGYATPQGNADWVTALMTAPKTEEQAPADGEPPEEALPDEELDSTEPPKEAPIEEPAQIASGDFAEPASEKLVEAASDTQEPAVEHAPDDELEAA